MKATKLDKVKTSQIIKDKSLNRYENVVLFPEKLAKANEMLQKVGLDKIKKHLDLSKS